MAVFERLGEQSRRARFNGPKPCLTGAELRQLATVDSSHHALVAYVEGDPQPVAIARLVRNGHDSAEIAFAVADSYQHRGIGSALAAELLARRTRGRHRARSPRSRRATTRPPLALIRRTANVLDVTLEGPELSIRAAIAYTFCA